MCVNCCKEGSDILKLDFGLYLDCVKKRSLLVSMQTAGRIMRPDDAGLKKYAYIIEVINTETNDLSVEIMSVMKLINYYKSILNLATDTEDIEDIEDKNLCKKFMELHSSTHIIEYKNEIHIDFRQNINPCIIKFDMKTIDWSVFRDYLDQTVKKICGIKTEDQFKMIIDKLKLIDSFQKDNDYDKVYKCLDHIKLNIPNYTEFKLRYKSLFETKTWYELLGLHFNYYSLDELKILLQDKNYTILNKKIYNKLKTKHNKLPKYPLEYYRLMQIVNYNDLIVNNFWINI